MIPLTERQLEMVRWLKERELGMTPVIDDMPPSMQETCAELVKLGVLTEIRNDRHTGGDDELIAWQLLPNPDWNP